MIPKTASPTRRIGPRSAGISMTPEEFDDLPELRQDRRRDYEQKRGEYLGVGVAEYWVIDRFQRKMSVYANSPAGIVERVVREDDSYETPLLPGFVLPLSLLLGRADLWPAKKRRRPTA
jgi:hypothetical protein